VKENQFKSAPKKLFDKPFPIDPNLFEIGNKLECIDPQHEALFCVMSVIDICGNKFNHVNIVLFT